MRAATQKSVTRLAAMPFGPRTILAAMAAAALALAAGGCGSSDDKSIPPANSDQLLTQLGNVRAQVESGDCELAKSSAIQFKSSVDSLPSDVQDDTRKDLDQLADNLSEITNVPNQVAREGASGPKGATASDTSRTEESTTAETTTSTTTSETTTKPDEPEPSEPQPSDQSSGQGSQGDQGVSGNLGGNGGTSGSTGGVKPGGGE